MCYYRDARVDDNPIISNATIKLTPSAEAACAPILNVELLLEVRDEFLPEANVLPFPNSLVVPVMPFRSLIHRVILAHQIFLPC